MLRRVKQGLEFITGVSGVTVPAINSAVFFKLAHDIVPEELFPYVGAAMIGSTLFAPFLQKTRGQLLLALAGYVPTTIASATIFHMVKPEDANPAAMFATAVGIGAGITVASAAYQYKQSKTKDGQGLEALDQLILVNKMAASVMMVATLTQGGTGSIFKEIKDENGDGATKAHKQMAFITGMLEAGSAAVGAVKLAHVTRQKYIADTKAEAAFHELGYSKVRKRKIKKTADVSNSLNEKLLNDHVDQDFAQLPASTQRAASVSSLVSSLRVDIAAGEYVPPASSVPASPQTPPAKSKFKGRVTTPGSGEVSIGVLSSSHSTVFGAGAAGEPKTPARQSSSRVVMPATLHKSGGRG